MSVIADQISRFTYFRGRVALAEILRGLGVEPGDLVAVQAFTCVAVPEAIMAIGAIPLWIDVDENSVNMSPAALKEAWRQEIKAVVIQHSFGMMADMNELEEAVAGRVPIVEDCCHTYLSSLGERQAGSFGIASFYSFEWGKPVVLGAGGAAATNDTDLAAKLATRLPGFQRPAFKKQFKLFLQFIGFSVLYRPSLYWTVKALFRRLSRAGLAVGNYNPIAPGMLSEDFNTRMSKSADRRLKHQLEKVAEESARRRTLAAIYHELFSGIETARLVAPTANSDDVMIRFPILVDDKPAFLRKAEANRIEAAEWYATPIHPLPEADWGQVSYEAGSCPNAEYMALHLVSFPMSASVTRKHVIQAASLLRQ